MKKKRIELSFGQSVIEYFLNRDIFYPSQNRSKLILESSNKTFFPPEPMRVGIQNIVESLSALGYGQDERLQEVWSLLEHYKDEQGRILLSQTLTKSSLPKEKVGAAGKWVSFYYLLAKNSGRASVSVPIGSESFTCKKELL